MWSFAEARSLTRSQAWEGDQVGVEALEDDEEGEGTSRMYILRISEAAWEMMALTA